MKGSEIRMWIWNFDDLWRSKYLLWRPTDFSIVITVLNFKCTLSLYQILKGSEIQMWIWMSNFDDLWRSKYWRWRPTDFSIVITMLNCICSPSLMELCGGHLVTSETVMTSGGQSIECGAQPTSASQWSCKTAYRTLRFIKFRGGLNVNLNASLNLLLSWQTSISSVFKTSQGG